jgi:hypothetical protein
MKLADERIFGRFTYPCVNALEKRGKIDSQYANMYKQTVRNNGSLPEDYMNYFSTAIVMCAREARKLSKDNIDRESVLNYFLSQSHDNVVEINHKICGDFDKEECKAFVGKVLKTGKDVLTVLTNRSLRTYEDVFSTNAKKGDFVIVHSGQVIDAMTKEEVAKYRFSR